MPVPCRIARVMALLGIAAMPGLAHADAAALDALLRDHAAQTSRRLHDEGRLDDALPWAQRALAAAEDLSGPRGLEVAEALNALGKLLRERGDYRGAESAHLRSLAIRESLLGPADREVARTLNNVAIVYQETGELRRAEVMYGRSLAIWQALPPGTELAMAQGNLGNLRSDLGQYVQAEQLLQESVATCESIGASEQDAMAIALSNLAVLYVEMGDSDRAEPLLLRSLAIRERMRGPLHHALAFPLVNLANVYVAQGRADEAPALLQRSLALWEQALGDQHPLVAAALSNLAEAYRRQGELARAEPLARRSLAIAEKALGPAHPGVAITLGHLAALVHDQGDAGSAEALYQRSFDAWSKSVGGDHPRAAKVLAALSTLAWSRGDLARAGQLLEQAAAVEDGHLDRLLASGSQAQKQVYVQALQSSTDLAISLHLHRGRDDLAGARLAATAVLRRKGRVLDATSEAIGVLRRQLASADRLLLNELASVQSERASVARSVEGGRGPGVAASNALAHDLRLRGEALERRQQALEARISQRSAALRGVFQPASLARVQRALPADTALVEWVAYRPIDPRASAAARPAAPRYAAFVLQARGEPAWIDLGDAATVDAAVARLRRALADPARPEVAALGRQLHRQVFEPLRPLLRASRLLLSPDGALNLVPFGALQDGRRRHLLEQYRISYLGTGRELLRPAPRADAAGPGLLLAAPDFDGEPAPTAAPTGAAARGGADVRGPLPGPFSPLPGSLREARAIHRIVPGLQLRLGSHASKAAVLAAHGPRILHLATHGFFLEPAAGMPRPREASLLHAGLALAGANRAGPGGTGSDSILSALEAASLDLWGTQLVVLSACETGLGEPSSGEGVYGLRRALTIAGAQSQVMSLWKVDDEATRALMVDYYRRLMRGQDRAEALRQAQLRLVRRSPAFKHPFYWAAFISTGAWGPIDRPRRPPR